jgi:WD40 repeat protein
MKRWLLKLGGVGMLASLFAVGVFAIALQPSDAPFLYYYSQEQGAFIISRADSSDGRILARFSMPDEWHIQGPGWSPSGRWFAWNSYPYSGTSYDLNVYVVRREGGEPLTILDSQGQILSASWAPNSDLLLVGYRPSLEVGSENALVYDVEHREVVIEFDGSEISDYIWFSRKEWTPDRQYISLFDGGDIRLIPINGGEPRLIQSRNGGTDSCSDFGLLPHWFDDGRLAYLHPEEAALVIEAIASQEQRVIELPQGIVKLVDWSHDENYALIYIQPFENQFKYDLWLVSVPDRAMELLSSDVSFSGNCNRPFSESMWNAKNEAVFTTTDGKLRWLSTAPTTIHEVVQPPLNGEVYVHSPIRWTPDGNVMFSWFTAIDRLYGSQIYTYDPASGESILVAPNDPSQVILGEYFAPLNGNYLAYQNGILNMSSGEYMELRFQTSRFTGSFGIEELYWHPTEGWLFLAGTRIENLNPINVVSMDGVIQRELALCPLRSVSCFGWLPDLRELDGNE